MAERPDLSHLNWETRVRIAVAETQGWAWESPRHPQDANDQYHWLINPARGALGASCRPGERAVIEPRLPDYLNDPAAWGPMMEELRGFMTYRGRTAFWWDGAYNREMLNLRLWWASLSGEEQHAALMRSEPASCPCGAGGGLGHPCAWCIPPAAWVAPATIDCTCGPWADDLRRAVCLAVLAKHGVEVPR